MTTTKATTTRWIVESAIMLAIATVLSELTFSGPWALGGGITFCSMLPIILISFRFGCRRGLITGLAFSLLQLILGIQNVQYADSAVMAAGIVLFDYIVPFSVLGLAGLFRNVTKSRKVNLVLGIAVTLCIRFLCHFATGVWIWEALWPNELGWAAPIWSLAYNGSYMLPELIITAIVAVLLYSSPLKKYFDGADLK
jgi:thiamine transporter